MSTNVQSYKKSSFGPAFFFLSKCRREALAHYYEFCRLMDDLADEPNIPNPGRQLDDWEAEVHRMYDGTPQTELGRLLQADAREFSMPPDRFLLLIEGMRADLTGRTYPTQQALDWYIYRVAAVVGLATLDILGVQGKQAEALAWQEGAAVQLTNIIRDVPEDAKLGRVYIPEELLTRFGLTRQDVLDNRAPRVLAAALQELAAQAEAYYEAAFKQMAGFARLKMIPCRVMGYVYLKNLAKIKKTGFLFARPVKLTKNEKLYSIAYALFKTFF